MRKLVFLILGLLAVPLSLFVVAPACGPYNYAIGGILCGLAAGVLVVHQVLDENMSFLVRALVASLSMILAGLWCPAALAAAFVWLTFSGGGSGSGRGASSAA